MASSYYDYQASKKKLIERVRSIHKSGWSPTPEKQSLTDFATLLDETADRFGEPELHFLEAEVDSDPPPLVGIAGNLIYDSESRAGYFQATAGRLRDIASIALAEANKLPNPRKKPALPYAATCLLHLMYHCEMPRPTLTDNSKAVSELQSICSGAGIVISDVRVRTAFGAALKKFDPLSPPPGSSDIFVIQRQVKLTLVLTPPT